ncbi:hypothetical protein ASZ78_012123, partial [Callipepla squamata]
MVKVNPRGCLGFSIPLSAAILPGTTAVQIEPVSGALGGSVLLPLNLSTSSTVKRISWKFTANGSIKKEVVEFNLELSTQPKYGRERLKLFNESVLQITALELSDSGVYEAQVTYQSTEVYERSFNLSVYGELKAEPVPEPQIQHELLSLSTQDCSITLRCLVPSRSGVETTWLHKSTSSTTWRQSDDGRTLNLTVPASTLNVIYTCVARNPVQEKSKSVYLVALCTHGKTLHCPPLPFWVLRTILTPRPHRGTQVEVAHLSGSAGSCAGSLEHRAVPAEEEEESQQRWALPW